MINIIDCAKSVRDDVNRVFFECFHDDEKYVALYDEYLLGFSRAVTFEEGGATQGLVTAFDIELVDCGRSLPAIHSYALGVFGEYRGRGVAKKLMLACDRLAREKGGAAHVGSPEELSLFDYYDKLGYTGKNHIIKLTLDCGLPEPEDGLALNPVELSASEYRLERDGFYRSRTAFLSYPEAAFEYLIAEQRADGGETLSLGEGGGLVFCTREEGRIIVRDLLVEDELAAQALLRLRKRYSGERLDVLLPVERRSISGMEYGAAQDYTPMFIKELGGVGVDFFSRCFSSQLCAIR